MPTFYCNYFFAWNSGSPYTRGPPGLCLPGLPHCYATVCSLYAGYLRRIVRRSPEASVREYV